MATQETEKNTMYSGNVYFPDVFKGCLHDCIYCKPSFQRQAKRQKQRCSKCYSFEPHAHFERMKGKTPATIGKQICFFPKGADLCFATYEQVEKILEFIDNNQQTTFYSHTKNPTFLLKHNSLPSNLIVGVTAETNRASFSNGWEILNLDSPFQLYSDISKALAPLDRLSILAELPYGRKAVTVEPILWHSNELISSIRKVKPEFVYVGYDTKNCKLPEPTLAKTKKLMSELATFTEVRPKTLREAWWYQPSVHAQDSKEAKL